MGVYSENRRTGKVPFEQMTPAQQRQFREFQRRGLAARRAASKRGKALEDVSENVETGLNTTFGGAAVYSGARELSLAAKMARSASKLKKFGKFGGAGMNLALGGLMLGSAVSGVYDKYKKKNAKKQKEPKGLDRFSATKWAEPIK